jgi:hypothetical protein
VHRQTQSQILRECNSCRRVLCTSSFGLSRRTKGGYNCTCKDCRNYRRRKSYSGDTTNVLPLNENNKAILNLVLQSRSKIEIPCLDLANNVRMLFIVEPIYGAVRFEIRASPEKSSNVFYTGYVDLFVDIASRFLNLRKVRLFKDSNLLLEWQFNPENNFQLSSND